MKRIIGIAEMAVSDDPGDLLVTHALGSCVGVAAYDLAAGVAGLIHCQLPLSQHDPQRALNYPATYVDTGVPAMFERMFSCGAEKHRLRIKVAGGATLLTDDKLFRVGERNLTVLRKLLWKNDLLIAAADVGERHARTMSVEVATGRVVITCGGESRELDEARRHCGARAPI